MRYAHGQYLNGAERALTITLNPSPDALYPAANLADPDPALVAQHSTNAANPTVTLDLAAFSPVSTGTTNYTVRSGERRRITCTSGTIKIQNLTTGKYLTSGAAWQVATANVLSGSGTVTYQVEDFATCQAATVILAVTVTTGGGCTDWPRWNCLAVFGHNLDPGLTVEARSSTDNFSGSNVLKATMAVKQPLFYSYVPAGVDERYVRLAMTGTNQAAAWYGLVMPTWIETAARNQQWGYEMRYDQPEVRHETQTGKAWVYPLTYYPRRIVKLTFDRRSDAQWREGRDEWMVRTQGGVYYSLVEPIDDEALIVYGRLDKSWASRRMFGALWEDDFLLSEAPLSRAL